MKHIHHIIPKHMGGTDDPSNFIELSIEEHAEEHRKLWEKHGLKGDWLAWQGLAKLISKKDILKMMCSHPGEKHPMYGKRGELSPLFGKKRSESAKRNISKSLKNYKRTKEHQNKLNNRFTESYIKKVTNSIARSWKIITPIGDEIIVHNMAEYCRQNNLNRSGMSSLAKHNKPYKGYYCEKVGT